MVRRRELQAAPANGQPRRAHRLEDFRRTQALWAVLFRCSYNVGIALCATRHSIEAWPVSWNITSSALQGHSSLHTDGRQYAAKLSDCRCGRAVCRLGMWRFAPTRTDSGRRHQNAPRRPCHARLSCSGFSLKNRPLLKFRTKNSLLKNSQIPYSHEPARPEWKPSRGPGPTRPAQCPIWM